jgi:hypothetical protein
VYKLGPHMERALCEVSAPPELWERVQAASMVEASVIETPPAKPFCWGLVWATAAAAILIATSATLVHLQRTGSDEAVALRALHSDSRLINFRCENPARLRAWVRAKTGLDLPLREESSPAIQLIGARTIENSRGVEVAYLAGNRDAVLLVSRAEAGALNVAHNRTSGNVSTWVMDGQRYTLACDNPSDLQLACKLCHLD